MSVSSDGTSGNNAHNSYVDELERSVGIGGSRVSLEPDFHGFEATPKVILERMNFENYLNTMQAYIKSVSESPASSDTKVMDMSVHSRRLSQKCCVNVFRDDLEKIQATINNKLFSEKISIGYAAFKCTVCEKTFSNKTELQNHKIKPHNIMFECKLNKNDKVQKRVSFSDHVIVHEVNEYIKCRKCTKIFESNKYLKAHIREFHKTRKCYICDYCNDNFADRLSFKSHIKLHCDVCKLLLPNKTEYTKHRQDVCKVLKHYKCKSCKEIFFKYMDLKDHSYEHINNYFICDICKDQFLTRCAVAHHISFLHSETRPTSLYTVMNLGADRLYLCNFCEESSIERGVLEKHVAVLPDLSNRVMTGYEDFYFCDQCSKKFSTEKDMLQHKWSHFLKNKDDNKTTLHSILINAKHKEIIKYKIDDEIIKTMQPRVILQKLNLFNREVIKSKGGDLKTLEHVNQDKESTNDDIPHFNNNNENTTTDVSSMNIYAEKVPNECIEPATTQKASIEMKANVEKIPDEKIETTMAQCVGAEMIINEGNVCNGEKIVPLRKKSIITKHQCQICGKYYSSNYCLKRHVKTQHFTHLTPSYHDLKCKTCEETFVWPSLLRSHKCIRFNLPEMPFEDARSEIHFDNLNPMCGNGFDDNIMDNNDDYINDDYMNDIDFEIPAPIVELTEYENFVPAVSGNENNVNTVNTNKLCDSLQNMGYKVVMQEVPIEF